MSKKTFCSVPPLWDFAEYGRHRCDDQSHKHISRAQARRYESQGRVRWLRRPDRDGNGGVVNLTAAPLGREIDRVEIRGISCYIGGYLAAAAALGEPWAQVMKLNIASRVRRSDRSSMGDESA